MVVAGREGLPVVEGVRRDGVLGRAVADGGRQARHLALGDVVATLSTDEEAIAAENDIGSQAGSLLDQFRLVQQKHGSGATDLEDVKSSPGVEARLLVGGRQ